MEISSLPAVAAFAPETPEEVALALRQARTSGLQAVVVASGHGLQPIGDLSGSMLLDMSGFNSVEVDPVTAVAKVGGGADWQGVTAAAADHGLAGPFGSSRTVGVAGYVSGGGIGPLSRHLGLAANSVQAFEIVTPDGVVRRIDAESDPDLFWALRGGGGGFGVITSLEIRLAPMPEMSGGLMIWPADRSGEVLPAWAEWTRTVPDDLTSSVRMVNLPDGSSLAMVLVAAPRKAGSLREDLDGLAALEPIQDTVGDTDPMSFMQAYSDPDEEGPPLIEHVLLDQVPAEAAAQAAEFSRPEGGVVMLELRHLGGALGRSPAGSGAQGHIDGEYSLFVIGAPDAAGPIAHVVDVLSGYGRGRTYFNFLTARGGRHTALSPDADRRLAELYAAVDPDRLMNHPQPMYDRGPSVAEPAVPPTHPDHPVAQTDNRPPHGGKRRRRSAGAGS